MTCLEVSWKWLGPGSYCSSFVTPCCAVVNTDVRGQGYAPKGETPVTYVVGGTRQKRSMISVEWGSAVVLPRTSPTALWLSSRFADYFVPKAHTETMQVLHPIPAQNCMAAILVQSLSLIPAPRIKFSNRFFSTPVCWPSKHSISITYRHFCPFIASPAPRRQKHQSPSQPIESKQLTRHPPSSRNSAKSDIFLHYPAFFRQISTKNDIFLHFPARI